MGFGENCCVRKGWTFTSLVLRCGHGRIGSVCECEVSWKGIDAIESMMVNCVRSWKRIAGDWLPRSYCSSEGGTPSWVLLPAWHQVLIAMLLPKSATFWGWWRSSAGS